MDCEKNDDEHGDDQQGMQAAQFARLIQPGDQLGHPLRCIERCCRLENDADHLAFGVKGTYVVAKGLVFPAMPLILVAVSEQVAVELLDVVLGDGDVRPGQENRFHHIGVTCDLLFVAGTESPDFEVAEQAFDLPVGQLAALDAG